MSFVSKCRNNAAESIQQMNRGCEAIRKDRKMLCNTFMVTTAAGAAAVALGVLGLGITVGIVIGSTVSVLAFSSMAYKYGKTDPATDPCVSTQQGKWNYQNIVKNFKEYNQRAIDKYKECNQIAIDKLKEYRQKINKPIVIAAATAAASIACGIVVFGFDRGFPIGAGLGLIALEARRYASAEEKKTKA